MLALFEATQRKDGRPREAIGAARAWILGEMNVAQVRLASSAAHAAARASEHPAAIAAARAAGYAVGTGHAAGHSIAAAAYARKAVAADNPKRLTAERQWQMRRLPKHLPAFVFRNPARG